MKHLRFFVIFLLCLMCGINSIFAQNTDAGVLSGEFSVSATKRVKFSQGNLQYQASTATWRLAANQYDFITDDNNNASATYNGWIDLFGYATSGWRAPGQIYANYQPWQHTQSGYSDKSSAKAYLHEDMTGANDSADWGVYNAIINGGNRKGLWRVLAKAEWYYLLNTRPYATSLRFKVRIDGDTQNKLGMLIFPDGATAPSFLDPTKSPTANSQSARDNYGNDITMAQFNQCVALGAVYLPAAGLSNDYGHSSDDYKWVRCHNCNGGDDVCEPDGMYWTSTHEHNPGGSNSTWSAYRLGFWEGSTWFFENDRDEYDPDLDYNCSYHKYSVRLVREIHTVSFYNYDGSLIYAEEVLHGNTANPPADPTKPYDCYDYVFAGWGADATQPVTSDMSFHAQFNQDGKHQFAVTFLNYDGFVVATETGVECGDPVSTSVVPTRPAVGEVSYDFRHWYKDGGNPSDPYITFNYPDTIVRAKYRSSVGDFEVTFKDDEGNVLAVDSFEWNAMPVCNGQYQKVSDCAYTYTFNRWVPNIVPVTGDAVYTAVYDTVTNVYEVRWLDWNDSVLATYYQNYDSLLVIPIVEESVWGSDSIYFFTGWTPDPGFPVPCHDVAYTAIYRALPRFYTDTVVRLGDTIITIVEYGTTPDLSLYENTIENCDSIYCFSHWTPAVAVQGTFNVSYTAVYTKTAKSPLLFEEYDTITQGDTYTWRGRDLTEAGVYYDSLQTVLGCDSVFKLTLTVNPFVCVAPTKLVATLISNKSFLFNWVNPTLGTGNKQANNFTYVLSATELDDPGAVKPTKTQRTTTMAQITAAQYNTEYHFYVKNVCRGVSSEWAHVAISSISGRPAVDGLYVVGIETGAITLAWMRNRFGNEIKWKVEVALASDSSLVKTLVASTTSIRVTGLDPETEYIFTVSPRLNSTNFGDPATVNGTTLDKPAMPVNLYGEITANRQITFYWQNGSEADANNFSYKLTSKYVDMSKDKYNDNPDAAGATDTAITFNNLSYGTTYYFYVRNVRADGAASDWALCHVKSNVVTPPVKNIHAEEATPNSLTVAWERGNAASAEPRWMVVLRRESDNGLIDSVNVAVMNCTFTGLTRGTDYVVRVYPRINSTTLGAAASAVLCTEQTCEAPINLTYVNDAYRAYTFSWENPTIGTTEVEPNNFTYILVNSAEPINPDSTYPTGRNFTETSLSVAKLTKGATYYFYVRNEYDGAVSAWAGPIVIEVPASATSAAAHYENENENENENFVVAEAYVNYDKLFVENIVEGSDVMVVDASGRVVYNAKVDDTRMECDLFVRGVYMVVIRGKMEQMIKVVY